MIEKVMYRAWSFPSAISHIVVSNLQIVSIYKFTSFLRGLGAILIRAGFNFIFSIFKIIN